MTIFLHSFRSEWLKKKHTAAAWLTLAGGFFIPVILLIARLNNPHKLYHDNTSGRLWQTLYNTSWQYMGILLLPMGVILVTSLITQLEFKNNTWKQLHTAPQPFAVVFFAKLLVILIMLLQFFVLFTIGIYLCGIIPAVFNKNLPYPADGFPVLLFAKGSLGFFVASLPVVSLQYLVSLVSKNFVVPVGVGMALFIAGLIGVKWKYGYLIPYSYCALEFSGARHLQTNASIWVWALGYFILFTLAAYILYLTKKDKS